MMPIQDGPTAPGQGPQPMSPQTIAMMEMLARVVSKTVIAELMSRFPELGIINPGAQVQTNRRQIICDNKGAPGLSQPYAVVNTWANLLAESIDTQLLLCEELRRLNNDEDDMEYVPRRKRGR